MLEFYGSGRCARACCWARRAIPRPRSCRAVRASGAEVVTVSLRRERRGERAGQGFWSLIRDARRARAAQHGRLSFGEGGGDHRPHGARAVRHAVDQARGDRRCRHAAARRVRPGRGGAHPVRGRLRGVSLHDRGSRGRRAPGRGGLPGADAVGRADRLRARAQQSLRPEARCARTFPTCRWWSMPASACRRTRRQALELGYDAVLLNTAVAEAGDPVAMARAFALAVEAGACRAAPQADRAARHGAAVDAGDRQRHFAHEACHPSTRSSTAPTGWQRLVPLGVRLVQLRIKERPEAEMRRQVQRGAGRAAPPRLPAHRQRLLAGWRSTGLRLRPSRPGGPGGRRREGAAPRRHAHRRQHARSCRAGAGLALATRLRGARARSITRRSSRCPGRRRAWQRIAEWKRLIGALPLVAIGGLTLERLPEVLAAGADIAAVVATSCAPPIRRRARGNGSASRRPRRAA